MAMIIPAPFNLTIVKGADFSISFDIDINEVILNLTGATVKSQIRISQKRSSDLIVDFNVETSIGDETGYLSDITISLTDAETEEIKQSAGFYDILVSDSTGVDIYYIRGRVVFIDTQTEKT